MNYNDLMVDSVSNWAEEDLIKEFKKRNRLEPPLTTTTTTTTTEPKKVTQLLLAIEFIEDEQFQYSVYNEVEGWRQITPYEFFDLMKLHHFKIKEVKKNILLLFCEA